MCKPYQCSISQVPLLHAKNHFQTPVIPIVAERNPSRSQLHYGRFIHPPHLKTLKIHSCRSPIFHCLCSHHNHFIFHHYYITTSHILSTFEFHVGSIFHYDSSQYFVLVLDDVEFIKVHLPMVLSHRLQHIIWDQDQSFYSALVFA